MFGGYYKKQTLNFLIFISFILFGIYFMFIRNKSIVFSLNLLMALFLVFIDFKSYRIPNKIVVPLIIINFLFCVFNLLFFKDPYHYKLLLNSISIFVVFLFLGSIYPSGLGGGDLKFAVFLSLFIEKNVLNLGLLIGAVFAGLFSLYMIKLGFLNKKSYIPYTPFLFLGVLFSMFFL